MRQRRQIVFGQRDQFNPAIDGAIAQHYGIGAQRFAHQAQRLTGRTREEFTNLQA